MASPGPFLSSEQNLHTPPIKIQRKQADFQDATSITGFEHSHRSPFNAMNQGFQSNLIVTPLL